MLNFGLWNEETIDPLSAQKNMCTYIGKLSELCSSKFLADIGSGLSAPAKLWKYTNPYLNIFCINTNFNQLTFDKNYTINKINSTATSLPLADNSFDRVVALESAQHFKPLEQFFKESARILKDSGILILAIPVTTGKFSGKNLGILNFTWSSEHYQYDYIKKLITSSFEIITEELVGQKVYLPLANYYIQNRLEIAKKIKKSYSSFVEPILYKSILKMQNASQNNIINYLIIKCKI